MKSLCMSPKSAANLTPHGPLIPSNKRYIDILTEYTNRLHTWFDQANMSVKVIANKTHSGKI